MEETRWTVSHSSMALISDVDNESTAELSTTLTTSTDDLPNMEALLAVYLTVIVFGILANTTVLVVLILAHREQGSHVNTLIANQSAIQLFFCVSVLMRLIMRVTYTIEYRGKNRLADNVICIMAENPIFASVGETAEKLGLVVITLERYFKIVHAIAHRKYYRDWMTKVGVALPWIGGACLKLFPEMGTTRVVNGKCLRTGVWPNEDMEKV